MSVAVVTLAAALIGVLVIGARLFALVNTAREHERREWTRERQTLLNRIKPETAQYVSNDEPVQIPPSVDMFDDESYFTKDELAEHAAAEEIAR